MAAAERVAPVVATSSMSRTGRWHARAAANRGLPHRSPAVRARWARTGAPAEQPCDRQPAAAGDRPGEQLRLVEAALAPAAARRWAPR